MRVVKSHSNILGLEVFFFPSLRHPPVCFSWWSSRPVRRVSRNCSTRVCVRFKPQSGISCSRCDLSLREQRVWDHDDEHTHEVNAHAQQGDLVGLGLPSCHSSSGSIRGMSHLRRRLSVFIHSSSRAPIVCMDWQGPHQLGSCLPISTCSEACLGSLPHADGSLMTL